MVLSQKQLGITSTIGAILIHFIYGSLYTWSNINSYFVSYLKHHDSPSIQLVDGFFLMPLINFISNISSYFGPIIDAKYGIKRCLLLSLTFILISNAFLLITTKLPLIYFSMLLFGSGIGIGYMAVMRNAWLYFPHKKGLLCGVILFGYGISAMVFTWISDTIVNPSYESVDINTGLFPQDIANRLYTYIQLLNIIILILSVIGYTLIVDYYKVNTIPNTHSNVNNDNRNINTNNIHNDTNTLPIREVFKDSRIWQMIMMYFCTTYFCYILTNTYRAFGQLNLINEKILSKLSTTSALLNGIARICWGCLFDKYGFKKLYVIIIIANIIISSCVYYCGTLFPFVYCILVIVNYLLIAGNTSLTTPLYPKIYGMKYATQINGIAIVIGGISSLMGPLIAKGVVKERSDFKLLYLSGTFFGVIGLINYLTFDEQPFKYKTLGDNGYMQEEELRIKKEIEKVSNELITQE